MAEKKRVIKGKRKRTRKAKPKEKARQKQKQRQTVNVQVSSGGSGGGTSFIPIPQAPAFDYSLLANLIRPANTVDMPIRAMAPISEPMQIRAAESPTLAEAKKESQERKGMQMEDINVAGRAESMREAYERLAKTVQTSAPSTTEAPYGYTASGRIRKSPLKSGARPKTRAPEFVAEEEIEPIYNPRSRGFIPVGSTGLGQRTEFEEDIFGRTMPKTSRIVGTEVESKFTKPKVVSFGDLPGGETSGFLTADTERPSGRGRMSSRGN